MLARTHEKKCIVGERKEGTNHSHCMVIITMEEQGNVMNKLLQE